MPPAFIATTDRNLDLLHELVAETIADESLQLPPGVTVVLVPDDDPAFAEANIASGVTAIHEGKNVYFHHVHRADQSSPQRDLVHAPDGWLLPSTEPRSLPK